MAGETETATSRAAALGRAETAATAIPRASAVESRQFIFSQRVLLSHREHDRPAQPVKGRRTRAMWEGLPAAGGAAADP